MSEPDPLGLIPATTTSRVPYFVAITPYPAVTKVVCWQDTWTGHIAANKRDTLENRNYAIAALETPTLVMPLSKGYVMFINEAQLSTNSGAPFGVVVDPTGTPLPAVASIGFRRDLIGNIERRSALWLPQS